VTVNREKLKRLYEEQLKKIDVKIAKRPPKVKKQPEQTPKKKKPFTMPKSFKIDPYDWRLSALESEKKELSARLNALDRLSCEKHPESDFVKMHGYFVETETYVCVECALEELEKIGNDYEIFVFKEFGVMKKVYSGTKVYSCPKCGFTKARPYHKRYHYNHGPLAAGAGYYIKCGECGTTIGTHMDWVS